MALSFHPSSKCKTSLRCTIHRESHGPHAEIYFLINGYKFIVPDARDYCDVTEHLIILQEAFEQGFTLSDNIENVK